MQDNYEQINKLVEACKNNDSAALFQLYEFARQQVIKGFTNIRSVSI